LFIFPFFYGQLQLPNCYIIYIINHPSYHERPSLSSTIIEVLYQPFTHLMYHEDDSNHFMHFISDVHYPYHPMHFISDVHYPYHPMHFVSDVLHPYYPFNLHRCTS
jgi:hypothetical protein